MLKKLFYTQISGGSQGAYQPKQFIMRLQEAGDKNEKLERDIVDFMKQPETTQTAKIK